MDLTLIMVQYIYNQIVVYLLRRMFMVKKESSKMNKYVVLEYIN